MDQQTGSPMNTNQAGGFAGPNSMALEALLPDYLRGQRWFSAKARTITRVRLAGQVPFAPDPAGPPQAYLTFIEVQYAEGAPQTFVLPLAVASGEAAARLQQQAPQAILAPTTDAGGANGVLYDASWDAGFAQALLQAIREGRRFGDEPLAIRATATSVFAQIAAASEAPLAPRLVGAEQSNTSIIYGQQFILKLFRRLEQGISPDLEIGRFLTARGFPHTPPLAGALERVEPQREPQTLAILQGFVPNQGDAWSYTLEQLAAYYDQAQARPVSPEMPVGRHLLDNAGQEIPLPIREALGSYLDSARLLGRSTAEMHLVLASDAQDPAFAPVPFDAAYQRALYDAVQRLAADAFQLLRARLAALPDTTRSSAAAVVAEEAALPDRFQPLLDREIHTLRTRVHGDYHLGQVLYTGRDFVIIDFEGEPLRSLDERRQKQSPLKDVAGMLRSFHYAAYAALFNRPADPDPEQVFLLEKWADAWHQWISAAFLGEYLRVAGPGDFLPRSRDNLQVLLDAYLLEKAIYELIYELNNRPDWLRIPLQGVRQLTSE
jgi:maltose alpha-D-glucosyltransferase/alpha-amylase